jgi:GT2 family glycosyltransferase
MTDANPPSIAGRPLVSVVVVNWNTKDLLEDCITSVEKHLADTPHEVIVVDNGSTDGSPELIASRFPENRLLVNPENLGFGRANNQGMAVAQGDCLLLLNSDARLPDGSVRALVEWLRDRPDVGVVGPRLEGPHGNLQPSAYRFGSIPLMLVEELGLYKLLRRERAASLLLGGYWSHDTERPVDWIVGACMLVRAEVFRTTGGFDPSIFLYGEEEEWCGRIATAGWRIVYSPRARIMHVGHETTRRFLGETTRVERCLEASDRLLARRSGLAGVAAGPTLRVAGALLKLTKVSIARALGRQRANDADVRALATIVLRYYGRQFRWPRPAMESDPGTR